MKHIKIFPLLFLIALFGNSKAQTYSQPAEVISVGGGESSESSYSNFGVIGETFVNRCVSGGDYDGYIGFFGGACDSTTNIRENINNQIISIYPNPTTNKLFIEMQNRQDVIISIFNSLGQIVYTAKIETDNKTINISGLQKGLYFVEIKDLKGNIMLSEKIIKE
ncbi:MAG: T9SS type A sorting domain-containing protein [Bacteroidetes bacterium]|nr:T9SS type A sorting domain-containing protein [Bacteroidota bacterium]